MQKSITKKILFIGPLFCRSDETRAGGTDVLFAQLLYDLDKYGVSYEVIDSNTDNFKNSLSTFLFILKNYFRKLKAYDHISLHGNTNHFIWIAPLVIFYAKLLGKSVSLRKFAGMMHKEYEEAGIIRKALARYALKHADTVFFETKYLVEYFKPFNPNTFWFPNVRHRPEGGFSKKEYEKRFIFIGSITKEKGIDELMQAARYVGEEYQIDLYGKIDERYYHEKDFSLPNLRYRGFVDPKRVIETIQQYDVLVLPSYREGYPGVIIESFMAGRPVLSTLLPSIKEMVEEGRTGFLIESKNLDALVKGICAFNKKNFEQMAEQAYSAGEDYDSQKASRQFLKKIGFADES